MTILSTHRLNVSHVSRVAFASLWALIFCVPWEEEAAAAQGIAVSHVIGAAAGVIGLFAIIATWRVRRLHPLHFLLGAFVVWIIATYCWSTAPELTVIKAASCLQLFVMVCLIWQFAPTERRQVSLLKAYVLGSYVSTLSTIYSFVTSTGKNLGLAEGRYTAAGFDENELGITLALSLVMSCYLLAHNAGWRPIWLIHIPLCILAICLTGSRGAFISCGVAILIFPFSFGSFSKGQKWLMLSTLLVLVATALAFLPQTTWDRIGTIQSEVSEGTLTKRTYIWAAGLDVYRQHPILGVGAGAFGPSVYSKLDIPYVAHNSYLSVLVELGAIGAILFAAVLLALLRLATLLPKLESRTWIVLLLTWSVAVLSVTWEHRKPTWFLFGLLIAQSAALGKPHETRVVREFLVSA
jgi:O-antigen ligase